MNQEDDFRTRFKSGTYLPRDKAAPPSVGDTLTEVKSPAAGSGRFKAPAPPSELLSALKNQSPAAPPTSVPEAAAQPPAAAATTHHDEPARAVQRAQPRWNRRLLVVAVLGALIMAGGLYGTYQTIGNRPSPTGTLGQSTATVDLGLFRQYQEFLGFPLFYPKDLPTGYSVDTDSYTTDQTNLSFLIKGPGAEQIAVNQQRLSANFVLPPSEAIKDDSIKVFEPRSFQTSSGNGNILARGDKYIGILTTDSTMIIFNLTGIAPDTGQKLIESFVSL